MFSNELTCQEPQIRVWDRSCGYWRRSLDSWWALRSVLMVCSPDTRNQSLKPDLLKLWPHLFSLTHKHTHTHVHAITRSHTKALGAISVCTHNLRCSGRAVTFTQLNELSNLTIPQPLHYRGISILQHVILPVHSSPTPLMQAPGQAGRNWIAYGILLQQMQWSVCVCVCVMNRRRRGWWRWWSFTLYGSCSFLLELIRAANNSLLHFQFKQ